MKRDWVYLAALLPYSTAISSSAAFGAGAEEWDQTIRPKKGQQDEDDESSEGEGGGKGAGANGAPGVETPGDPSAGEDAGGQNYAMSSPGSAPAGGHWPMAAAPQSDGMYAPAAGPSDGSMAHGASGGGGGGGVSVVSTMKMVAAQTLPPGETLPPGQNPVDPDGGIVEPDPADADAMMILLGGLAEGNGMGAGSSGDVVFDIVDYGSITFGYGYSTFMASGKDGAYADTFFDVTGADLVFSYGTGPSYGESAYSTTHVLAIDFEDESMFTEQQLAGYDWMQLLSEGPFAQNILGPEEDVSVDGNSSLVTFEADFHGNSHPDSVNFATLSYDNVGSVVTAQLEGGQTWLSIQGEAEGVESLAFSEGNVLQIEDEYSSVGGSAMGIA